MNGPKEKINIARIIYDAYPHSDLLPIEPDKDCQNLQSLLKKVTSENIGDSLFRFMVVEVAEGGESTLAGAIRVLEQAKQDVEAVLHALQSKNINQLHDGQECNCQCTCTIYCKAAEYIAEQGNKIFTGHMQGGLWNARCIDAYILSKKQDDKAAYEFLIKFGDQYARTVSADKKLFWEKIKESAAALITAKS